MVKPSREIATFRNGTVTEERAHVTPKSLDVQMPS